MARLGRAQPFAPKDKRPDLGPVYFDTISSSGAEVSLSTYTWTHVTGGNTNRLLIVGFAILGAGTVTSVTYPKAASPTNLTFLRADANGLFRSELWYLIAPDSGSGTVTVVLSGVTTSDAGAASYWHVDQTTPFSANAGGNGTNTPASAAVTPGSITNRVFGNLAAASASGITDQAGQALRYTTNTAAGTSRAAEEGTVMGLTSTTLQWNGLGLTDSWGVSLAAIQPPQPSTGILFRRSLTQRLGSRAAA